MINQLTLKDSTERSTKVNLTPVTIFVGPNNSGKSLLLREIQSFASSSFLHDKKILGGVALSKVKNPEKEIKSFTLQPNSNETIQPGHIKFGTTQEYHHLPEKRVLEMLNDPESFIDSYCTFYLRRKVLKLDGHNRIQLTSDMGMGDIKYPESLFAKLFVDNERRERIRKIIFDAFGKYFVLDITQLPNLSIRLADTKPEIALEKSLDTDAVDFFRNATSIHDTSDGTKAYVGIITSMFSDMKISIIDEPEAFLHPPLAYKIGLEVSKISAEFDNRLFASTHSSNFLIGCIRSGVEINVIRLTYANEVGKVKVLSNDKIKEMMNDPMLRSTGVLDALFYKYVIVTEGEIDRAFYGEINHRLLEEDPKNGIDNCLFLSANGKDNIHRIVRPLREMGIPTVAIYDLDIIKNEGNSWTNALNSSFLPPGAVTTLGQTRSGINAKYKALDVDMKKHGINGLTSEEKPNAQWLINQLSPYGAFIVEKGEVECWLKDLEIPGSKTYWLTKMFERMGSDRSNKNYLKPSLNDVWAFMKEIKLWLEDEKRQGMPSE